MNHKVTTLAWPFLVLILYTNPTAADEVYRLTQEISTYFRSDSHKDKVIEACRALGHMGPKAKKAAASILEQHVTIEFSTVEYKDQVIAAIQALGHMGEGVGILNLKVNLHFAVDKQKDQVIAAIQALGHMGPKAKKAVDTLNRKVVRYFDSDDQKDQVIAAIQALGHMGPTAKDAVGSLETQAAINSTVKSHKDRVAAVKRAVSMIRSEIRRGTCHELDLHHKTLKLRTDAGIVSIPINSKIIGIQEIKKGTRIIIILQKEGGKVTEIIRIGC